jgi:dTDP-4-amino-4,6-dideoxygalactose transaminase
MDHLEADGISTRQGTHTAALQGFYANRYGYRPADFPNAYLAEQLSIALPLFPSMSDDELSFVAESIDAAFAAVWHP